MKKFLSLVLALVMTMSLVTISAGAKDFTDDDKVNYAEAIDVLSEVKVIDGYTDGSFKPQTQLNRGQAAKILCNMILGPTTASALKADAAPFKDVAADNTFAAYIAFCAKEGIIDGYTDGTFKPSAPLTGYAFMKFLLGALGYDKDIEGYNGNNWSINVAKRALNIGLDDGLTEDFDGTKIVTREEACLFAFNALTADMVHYGNKTTVSVGGAEVVVGAGEATKNTNSTADDYRKTVANRDTVEQFCEKYFPKLELRDNVSSDAFGRPANVWYVKNDKIGTYSKTPDLTYTKDVKSETIYKDLDLSNPYDYARVVDGVDQTRFDVRKSGSGSYNAYDKKVSNALPAGVVVGNGSQIEVYKDEQKIVVVNEYLMQVAGEYNEKKETLTLTTVSEKNLLLPALNSVVLSSDDFAGLDEFKDEEYVIVTVANGDIKSIKSAEKVTGTVTEYVDDDTVTVDGTEYSYSAATKTTPADVSVTPYLVKESYDLYLDSNGNVLLAKGVEATDSVVYITEFAPSSQLSANSKVVAYAYFLDGTEEEITVSKLNSSKVTSSNLTDTDTDGLEELGGKETGWFKYTEKDGKYELRSMTLGTDYTDVVLAGSETVVDYSANHTLIDDGTNQYKGNATTKFVVVKPNGNVVTYEGIKNVADINATAGSRVAVIYGGAYAKYVFVKLATGSTVSGGSTSSDLIYVMKLNATSGHDSDSDTYYRYNAVLNGEDTKVKFDDGSIIPTVGMLYTNVEYNSKGYVIAADPVGYDNDSDGNLELNAAVDSDVYSYTRVFTSKAAGDVVTLKIKTINFWDNTNSVADSFYMADGAKVYVNKTNSSDVDIYSAGQFIANFKDMNSKSVTICGVMNADAEYSALYVTWA